MSNKLLDKSTRLLKYMLRPHSAARLYRVAWHSRPLADIKLKL